MTKEDIKKIDIVDYLILRGYEPTKNLENSKYAMFRSPLREDNSPSFCVNKDTNSWRDRANGDYGDIINLAMGIDNCDYNTACKNLSNGSFSFHKPLQKEKINKIKYLRDEPIKKKNLFGYACSYRKINPEVLKLYCREVYYLNGDREFYSIGFPTVSGGFELNSQGKEKNFKANTGKKDISFIPGTEDHNEVMIFEGFFDFLAALTYYRKVESKIDVLVINSVELIEKGIDFIIDRKYKKQYLYLDNDEAGDKACNILSKIEIETIDKRKTFQKFKDFNDFLINSHNAKK